jgi:uroporphyrinogen decarboxylase
MSLFTVGLIFILVLLLLLLMRMPVGLAMTLVGFLGLAYITNIGGGYGQLRIVPMSLTANYDYCVIPLFMLMGSLGYALPFHVEYHQRLTELGINRFLFHICGDQNFNLPLLAEAVPWPHPSLLSFGHEVDIDDAARYFPNDIIYGNIDTTIIQTGSPNEVYDCALGVVQKGRKAPGGFVLSAGCELPPMVPPANVFAITKAVNDQGWYT